MDIGSSSLIVNVIDIFKCAFFTKRWKSNGLSIMFYIFGKEKQRGPGILRDIRERKQIPYYMEKAGSLAKSRIILYSCFEGFVAFILVLRSNTLTFRSKHTHLFNLTFKVSWPIRYILYT
mgnify:CR=1 FL=1